jgi:protein TonB
MELKKSPKKDLERKRLVFFQIGMVIALVLAILAFEWRTYDKKMNIQTRLPGEITLLELPDVTKHTKPKPPAPPPQPVVKIRIKPNDEYVEEHPVIDVGVDFNDPMPEAVFFSEEPAVIEPEIFKVVEDMPEFPGGEQALYRFLGENMTYPAAAKEVGISGVVYVCFVVEPDGTTTHFRILRSPHPSLSGEALRVLKLMPEWKPGRQRTKAVRVEYNIPINFKLN